MNRRAKHKRPVESHQPAGRNELRTPARVPTGTRKRTLAAIAIALVLLIVAVFGQTGQHDFVNFDDDVYVYANRHVTGGLTSDAIGWAMTAHHANNWHPLTWLSHMVDVGLYGVKWPGGHHLTNVALHAATAVLLLLVLYGMTGAFWPSAFVAAVFAIHPLRVESVAWVSERKDVLSGLLFMLTLAAYVSYARRRFSWLRYGAVVVLFVAGLMAKPMLVTLPFVLLLLDYWPLGRLASSNSLGVQKLPLGNTRNIRQATPWQLVVEKLPLIGLSVASCVVTSIAQRSAMASLDVVTPLWRVANAVVAAAAYVLQLFWPAGLAVLYPHPGSDIAIEKVVVATCFLAAATFGAWTLRRRLPYVFVGWFWYLGMLVPVIGLLQVGDQAMADRYTYLPQIGLCVAITWAVVETFAVRPHRRMAFGLASIAIVVTLSVAAWRQTTYWRNSETLWNRALASTSRNPLANNNLAAHLRLVKKYDVAMEHAKQSVAEYEAASHRNPKAADAYYNLGLLTADKGDTDGAMRCYQRALQAHHGHTPSLNSLGAVYARRGELAIALPLFEQAAAGDPYFLEAHSNLATALLQTKNTAKAVPVLRRIVQLEPDRVADLNELAWILATSADPSLRNGAEAVDLAQRAAQISGRRDPAVLGTLAAAYAEGGRFAEAAQTAREALELATLNRNAALADSIRSKLALYEARKPFHVPVAP